jgi:hypothetical protein
VHSGAHSQRATTRIVCAAMGDVGWRVAGRRWPAVVAALVWDAFAGRAARQMAARTHRRASMSSPARF